MALSSVTFSGLVLMSEIERWVLEFFCVVVLFKFVSTVRMLSVQSKRAFMATSLCDGTVESVIRQDVSCVRKVQCLDMTAQHSADTFKECMCLCISTSMCKVLHMYESTN